MGCCQNWMSQINLSSSKTSKTDLRLSMSLHTEDSMLGGLPECKLQKLKVLLRQSLLSSETSIRGFSQQVAKLDLRFSRKTTQPLPKHTEDLECPICSFVYNRHKEKPLLLPCGHTFCKKCLEKDYTALRRIRCPFDRSEVKDSPEHLPVVYSLISLSESLRDKPMCSEHKQPLAYYCGSHKEFICESCVPSHKSDNLQKIEESTAVKEWYDSAIQGVSHLKDLREKLEVAKLQAQTAEQQVRLAFKNHFDEVQRDYESTALHLKRKIDAYSQDIDASLNLLLKTLPSKAIEDTEDAIRSEISKASDFLNNFENLSLNQKLEKFAEGPLKNLDLQIPDLKPLYRAKETISRANTEKGTIF